MYNNMQQQNKGASFTNATGKTIPQLFAKLEKILPGRSYSKCLPEPNKNYSLIQYVKELIFFFVSNKLKQLSAVLSLKAQRTLNSVYSQQSIAILANSINLDEALVKGLHYNIPLIQVVMLTPKGQAIIREKLLLNFAISHLVNQNFILYGDWQKNNDLLSIFQQIPISGEETSNIEGMYFRKGQLVYGFLPMEVISSSEQQILEENLIELRNIYFKYNEPSINNRQNNNPNRDLPDILSEPDQSEIVASPSMFQPRNPDDVADNFNDSDEEQFADQPPG